MTGTTEAGRDPATGELANEVARLEAALGAAERRAAELATDLWAIPATVAEAKVAALSEEANAEIFDTAAAARVRVQSFDGALAFVDAGRDIGEIAASLPKWLAERDALEDGDETRLSCAAVYGIDDFRDTLTTLRAAAPALVADAGSRAAATANAKRRAGFEHTAAEQSLAHAEHRSVELPGMIAEAEVKVEAARAAAGAARTADDAAVARADALEAERRAEAATLADRFKAYRVWCDWAVTPGMVGVDFYFPYNSEHDDVSDDDDEIFDSRTGKFREPDASERKARRRQEQAERDFKRQMTDELKGYYATAYAHLRKLGCVTGATDDADSRVYLIVEASVELPLVVRPGASDGEADLCLGLMPGQVSRAYPDQTITGFLLAVPVGLDVAFAELAGLGAMHELGAWGGMRSPDLLPVDGEALAASAARAAVPADKMELRLERLRRVGHRLDLYPMVLAPEEIDRSGERDAVVGMSPFGRVIMLAGEGGVGKTSAAHCLLMAVGSSTGPKEFLGQLVTGTHPVALITGEESAEEVAERQEILRATWGEPNLTLRAGGGWAFCKSALAELEALPDYGLLVVDSVTSLCAGSHIDGAEVARFLQPFIDFARRKKWAVLVLHHLSQGKGPLIDRISGARAFINLSRNVMVMEAARGGRRKVTTVKHNFLPGKVWLEKEQSRLFEADGATLRLLPVADGRAENGASDDEADIEAAVLAAVRRLNAEGVRVNKSGKSGLYRLNAPEVAGIGRDPLEAVMGGLIDDGELVVTPNGLTIAGQAEAT